MNDHADGSPFRLTPIYGAYKPTLCIGEATAQRPVNPKILEEIARVMIGHQDWRLLRWMPISIIRIQRALRDCPKAGHNEAARTLIGTIPKIKEFHLLEAEFGKSSVYRSGVVRESQ